MADRERMPSGMSVRPSRISALSASSSPVPTFRQGKWPVRSSKAMTPMPHQSPAKDPSCSRVSGGTKARDPQGDMGSSSKEAAEGSTSMACTSLAVRIFLHSPKSMSLRCPASSSMMFCKPQSKRRREVRPRCQVAF